MLTVERGGPRPTVARDRPRRDVVGPVVDTVVVVAVLALVGLGGLNLYAIAGWSPVAHQSVVVAVGVVILVLLRWQPAERLRLLGWGCYVVGVVLLAAVLAVGPDVNAVRRWLDVGWFQIQPSELAKLGLLVVLADVLGSDRRPFHRFALALVLAVVPIGLTVVEPDLSTAMLLTALTLALLLLARVPVRYLLPFLAGFVVLAPLVVPLLRPYQLERLQTFVSASRDPAATGWASLQAHIAIASGGLTGVSRAPLHRIVAMYLPGRQTDLAFASLVEQWGVAAGAVAVFATLIVLWRVALAGRATPSRRGSLVGSGLAVLLGVQVITCVGGTLGVLPIAGVPFPLISYGGAAALAYLAAIGVVLGVRREGVRRRLWIGPRWSARRRPWVRTAAFGVTGALAALSVYGWGQYAGGAPYRVAGTTQMSRCIRLPAARGAITDRHGVPVAVDAALDDVVAVPGLLRDDPAAVTTLAVLLGQPADGLRQRLATARSLSLPVATVPPDLGSRVAAAQVPGVFVEPSPRRVYPSGPLLAPILGFVGIATPAETKRWPDLQPGELVGRAGIEQQYDPVLRGVDGEQCMYVDPAGTPVAMGQRHDPVPGATLRLTLDLGLQQSVTASLAAAMAGAAGAPQGDIGAAVVMDPNTGQVLAMASAPSYDNSLYGPPVDGAALQRAMQGPGNPMLEHATQVAAPPGSSFKLVVAAADMVHGVVPPDQRVVTGGSFTYGGHTFANWRSFGPQNLVQAIQWSNDVYFYKLALAVGPERIHDVATALGVAQPTGIDLPGEHAGSLGTPASVRAAGGHWYGGTTVILGIGQGAVTATPLQAARWAAAVATGRLATPRLGFGFDTGAGHLDPLPSPPPTALPFAAALDPVRQGMRQAVLGGTASILNSLPVPAAGKTGTAEDPASPNGSTDSWFLAVAPFDHPSVVVSSFIRGGGHGAQSSGPVVQQTLQYVFAHQAEIGAG